MHMNARINTTASKIHIIKTNILFSGIHQAVRYSHRTIKILTSLQGHKDMQHGIDLLSSHKQ